MAAPIEFVDSSLSLDAREWRQDWPDDEDQSLKPASPGAIDEKAEDRPLEAASSEAHDEKKEIRIARWRPHLQGRMMRRRMMMASKSARMRWSAKSQNAILK